MSASSPSRKMTNTSTITDILISCKFSRPARVLQPQMWRETRLRSASPLHTTLAWTWPPPHTVPQTWGMTTTKLLSWEKFWKWTDIKQGSAELRVFFCSPPLFLIHRLGFYMPNADPYRAEEMKQRHIWRPASKKNSPNAWKLPSKTAP